MAFGFQGFGIGAPAVVPVGSNPTATIGLAAINGSAPTFMTSDSAPPLSQAIMPVWTGIHSFLQSPGANTVGDGVVLENTTAASSGNQQYSPAIHLSGRGWKTLTGGASRSVDWHIYAQPVQGTGNPTANLNFDSSINGASYITRLAITANGITILGLSVTGNSVLNFVTFNQLSIATGSPAAGSLVNFFGLPTSNSGLNSGDLFVVPAATAVSNGYNVVCMN